MPEEAWTYPYGAIMDGGQDVDFRPIIDWLHVAMTKKVGDNKSPLAMLRSTAPLADRDILRPLHHMLTQHHQGLDPALQRVKGSLITTHIREVAFKLLFDREAKAQAQKADSKKGILDPLGSNLTYLHHLGQVSTHKVLPSIWKKIEGDLKHQHLPTLQRALDDTAHRLRVRAPIIATPGLLNLTLALGCHMDHLDNLGTCLYQFELGQ